MERCPACGQTYNSNRMYTVAEVEAEFGFSADLIRRWMNREGLIYRCWYLGRGRVRRLIQGKRLMEFLDAKIPEFNEYSDHKACRVNRWRRDAGRKGQASMAKKRYAVKVDPGALVSEHGAGYGGQRSTHEVPDTTIIPPGKTIIEP